MAQLLQLVHTHNWSRRSVVRRWGIVIELLIHRFDEAVFAYCVRGVGQANFESRASDSNDSLRLTAAEKGGNLMLLAAYIARNDVAEARDLGNLWLLFLLSGFQVASEPLRAELSCVLPMASAVAGCA